jgi:cytochrome c553
VALRLPRARSPALEGFEHQIAHSADISLGAFHAVGFGFAIFGALAVNTGALSQKLAVEPQERGVVEKCFSCHGSQQN